MNVNILAFKFAPQHPPFGVRRPVSFFSFVFLRIFAKSARSNVMKLLVLSLWLSKKTMYVLLTKKKKVMQALADAVKDSWRPVYYHWNFQAASPHVFSSCGFSSLPKVFWQGWCFWYCKRLFILLRKKRCFSLDYPLKIRLTKHWSVGP